MSDGDALLRTVLIDPASDAARLVYADHLEQNAGDRPCPNGTCRAGLVWAIDVANRWTSRPCSRCGEAGRESDGRAERAEFIRVQCELARLEPMARAADLLWELATDASRDALRRFDELRPREWDLIEERWNAWAKPIPATCLLNRNPQAGGAVGVLYRRGFVERIELPTAQFLEHARELFAAHPILTVRLTDRRPRPVQPEPESADVWHIWQLAPYPHSTGRPEFCLPHHIHCLPHHIHRVLVWEEMNLEGWTNFGYRTEANAQAALSDACVKYGRSLAGLPSLQLLQKESV